MSLVSPYRGDQESRLVLTRFIIDGKVKCEETNNILSALIGPIATKSGRPGLTESCTCRRRRGPIPPRLTPWPGITLSRDGTT